MSTDKILEVEKCAAMTTYALHLQTVMLPNLFSGLFVGVMATVTECLFSSPATL